MKAAAEMTPMAETCVICRREHRGSRACRSCIGRVQADLRSITERGLMDDLETTICRLDTLGADPGKSSRTRLAWNEAAAEAAWVLRNTLTAWARDLWDTNGARTPLPAGPNAVDLALFLLRYPSQLANHPTIDQLADEVSSAIKNAERATDRLADTRVFLGLCDPDNGECDRELYSYRWQTEVKCPSCGTTWQVEDRRTWLLAKAEDETATAETLAGLLTRLGVEITPKNIQDAARKGLVTNVSIDSHTKRRRYRVGAVLDAFLPARTAAA